MVSNPIGSATSEVAVLTVNVPPGVPNISAQPGNQAFGWERRRCSQSGPRAIQS